MIVPFSTKKNLAAAIFPMDFYRFRHTQESVVDPQQKKVIERPLWIVGISPFEPLISEESVFVVHLGTPLFTARWTTNDEIMKQVTAVDYYDEDLNIMIYETLLLNNNAERLHEWLVEAVCAVAYSKGMIAIATIEEAH